MDKQWSGLIGSALLVIACSSSAPPSASPTKTENVANPTPTPVTAPATTPTPTGLELLCEGPDITFRITDATLTPSDNARYRAEKRWNEVNATYTLEAKGRTLSGRVAGPRDQDFVFMSLEDSGPEASVPKVKLIVNSADGQLASLGWSVESADKQEARSKVTCSGSLMTATPSAR